MMLLCINLRIEVGIELDDMLEKLKKTQFGSREVGLCGTKMEIEITDFFRQSTKQRGSKNSVLGISDNNEAWITDDNSIENVFCSLFNYLF